MIRDRGSNFTAAFDAVLAAAGTKPTCCGYCATTKPTTISTGHTAPCTAPRPLKPLPESADLDLYRVRKHTHVAGLINEYRLVA